MLWVRRIGLEHDRRDEAMDPSIESQDSLNAIPLG